MLTAQHRGRGLRRRRRPTPNRRLRRRDFGRLPRGGEHTPKDDLRAPKDDLYAPKDDLYAPKDDLCTAKDDLCAPKDDLCTAKDDLCTAKDDLCTAKDDLCTAKDCPHGARTMHPVSFGDDKRYTYCRHQAGTLKKALPCGFATRKDTSLGSPSDCGSANHPCRRSHHGQGRSGVE